MFNKLLGKSILNVNSLKSSQYLAVSTTSNHIRDGGKKKSFGNTSRVDKKSHVYFVF